MKDYNHDLANFFDACGIEKDDTDYALGVLDDFFAISSSSQVVELIEKRIKDGDEILLRVCIIMFMAKLTVLVTFNSMGGSPVESKRVKMNTPVEEPEEPVKPGYIFDGWYTGQLYLTRWDFTNNVLFNMTLYAKWIEI